MSASKEQFFQEARRVLSRHFNQQRVEFATGLIVEVPIRFVAKRPRKTKLGDCGLSSDRSHFQVTFTQPDPKGTGDRSYLTLIHEIAHALTDTRHHGRRLKPHGLEWKTIFGEIIVKAVQLELFSPALRGPLLRHARNPAARSGVDSDLERAFSEIEQDPDAPSLRVEDVPMGHWFQLGDGKHFRRGILRRTRYLCTNLKGQEYVISAGAKAQSVSKTAPVMETITSSRPEKGTLESLAEGRRFKIKGPLIFTKGPRLRKYFRCAASDGKTYRVHPKAPVQVISGDE